jgi:hypothetical protein
MRWDDWPRSSEDYDLYLVRASDGRVIDQSETAQTGTQPPYEQVCSQSAFGLIGEYAVSVVLRSPAARSRIDIFFGNGHLVQENDLTGTVSEPATSAAALAVGAACWQSGVIEFYSSRGPTLDGRTKPDLSAPDQVTTATFGSSQGCSGAGFPGTSAASPHVAGAAALALQASPRSVPSETQRLLERKARDRGSPGKDDDYGSGALALGAPPFRADVEAPTITALPARGQRGRLVRLRFRTSDPDSRQVQVVVRVLSHGRLAARLQGRRRANGAVQYLGWRPPRPGIVRFCARARDPGGNESKESCARLVVR